MIAVHKAFGLIDANISPLSIQRVNLLDGVGRVLAEPALAQTDLPPFAQSAVDGYAVNSSDLHAAPLTLPLSGTIAAAAQRKLPELKAGTAMRIFTGGILPSGADTIVRQELTEQARNGIKILKTVSANTDLRQRGEELANGTELAASGQRLTAGLAGSLANGGIDKLSVSRQPAITVLITGDEITAAGKGLKLGQVYDANGPIIKATLTSWGYQKIRLQYVADTERAVKKALKRAFAEADLVITTGGVSVGDLDYIPAVSEQLGAERLFWKVAQKPGKPLYFAKLKKTLLLGLPGNPAAVLINLHTHVRRALDRLENLQVPGPRWQNGTLAVALQPDRKRDTWLRVAINQDSEQRLLLEPLPAQASHMLSNLQTATALAHLPAGDALLPAGSTLQWLAL